MIFRVNRTKTGSVCLAILLAGFQIAANPGGSCGGTLPVELPGNSVWAPTENPHIVENDLLIPPGAALTVEPGTKVLFGAGASLVIRGSIHAAGTLENPILFSSVNSNPAPGDWGNLRFEDVDGKVVQTVGKSPSEPSTLKYCIVEYGGEPIYASNKNARGGAIHCRRSSPRIENVIMRQNRSWRGGAIYCIEFSSPSISDCLFLENEAEESGGAIASFFYSNPAIENNTFQGNRAEQHGGALYCSFSSPSIVGNIIENNLAGSHGGALYASNSITHAPLRFEKNVLFSNRAQDGSNSIYLTAGFDAVLQDNCFFAGGGIEVYIDALSASPDLSRNYFGVRSVADLEPKIFTVLFNSVQGAVLIESALESPPCDVPNAPRDITSIELCADQTYSRKLTGPLEIGEAIHIEVRALDQNPYHEDWIPLHLWTDLHPKVLKALAWETGPSTGIYRFKGWLTHAPDVGGDTIASVAGDMLHCRISAREEFEIKRPVGFGDALGDGSQAGVGETLITD
jgi:predicted outer membrane repeat protein